MKKVVLLAINSKYIHSTLAVWLIAGSIAHHDAVVVETNINQSDGDILTAVCAHNPDVVGISTYIWNAGKLPGILEELRARLPDAALVLGGPEAAHNVDYWLSLGADHVLVGAGESTFPAFLDGTQPTPTFIDPFDSKYIAALDGKIAYIEASRGCPFNCAFCLSGESAVEFFPLDAVKARLIKLERANVRVVKFVDRTFNAHPARTYDLIEFIIGLNSKNRFHFEVAADLFEPRTLELLASAPAGLFQIEAGLQSFFEPALAASTRKSDLQKAVSNIQTILQAGNIHIHLDLIAGLPHETLSDFANSFNQAYKIGAHKLQLGFLKMLHGSALRKNEPSIIFESKPPYQIIESPWLSRNELEILHKTEHALQDTYNKGHFMGTIKYALEKSGLTAFEFYRALGEFVQKKGRALEAYAEEIYKFCMTLQGVSSEDLCEYMIIDYLSMTKGVNMPKFLKLGNKVQMKPIIEHVEAALGRKIRKNEAALLPSGKRVYVDSMQQNVITRLYKIYNI
ncbi:MAG: B12-binding domain-containing radical SAM protein [Defluviitaleaceae bacterium]|nr:B12-binding domain-containing radical SAM protein [Defluviitaleaceae bacterium]